MEKTGGPRRRIFSAQGLVDSFLLEPQHKKYGAPSSGIQKTKSNHWIPRCNSVLAKTALRLAPPHGGWKEELSKNKSLALV